MPESKKHSHLFAGCALAVLVGWATLIVGVAVLASKKSGSGQVAVQAPNTPADGAAIYQGSSRSLAHHREGRLGAAPNFTHVRLSHSTGRGLFAGRAAPSKGVILSQGGRNLAETQADSNGDWQISTVIDRTPGTHAFSLEQRARAGQYVAGESIRLRVPSQHRETVDFTSGGSDGGFQLVAARAETDDIGSAASKKFDELFNAGRLNGSAPKEGAQARGRNYAQRNGSMLDPAWNWLEDANRSYLGEVVPRIKRGGRSQTIAVTGDGEKQKTDNVDRPRRDNDAGSWPKIGSWAPLGIGEWLLAARRGYSTEIVPRLSGQVPSVITTRRTDEEEVGETEAERRRRLERERAATEEAERERLAAERRRREEEQRRLAAEEEAKRAAEQSRRDAEEEARKLAEERRRVLERRAEQQRLAALNARKKAEEDLREAERQREREAELGRAQEEAEKAALERERLAELERERTQEEERLRLARLRLQEQERAREEAERRRLEAERQDRLTAEAEAIRQRLAAQAKLREREAEQRRAERQNEERRLAAERARREALAVPVPTKRSQRLARNIVREPGTLERSSRTTERQRGDRRGLNRFRLRDTEIEFRTAKRTAPSTDTRETRESAPKTPRRSWTQRLRDGLNRFKVRDTEIEISTPERTVARASKAARETVRLTKKATLKTNTTSDRKVALLRTREISRKAKARRRKAKVRAYRRRLRNSVHAQCGRKTARRVKLGRTYVVRRGDSLWRISKRHYRRGRYFKKIYNANSNKIRKASLIYPCQELVVPRR